MVFDYLSVESGVGTMKKMVWICMLLFVALTAFGMDAEFWGDMTDMQRKIYLLGFFDGIKGFFEILDIENLDFLAPQPEVVNKIVLHMLIILAPIYDTELKQNAFGTALLSATGDTPSDREVIEKMVEILRLYGT